MNYNEKFELDRALEKVMGIIEDDKHLTDEQFDELANIYSTAENWDDFWNLKDKYNDFTKKEA